MSSLGVTIQEQSKNGSPSAKPKLQIVSREPFSAVASFLLGLIAGLGGAMGLFVIFFG
jgi:hypothetical protein